MNTSAPASSTRDLADRKQMIQKVIRAMGMLPVLILLCIGFYFLSGRFLSLQNLSIIIQQASINMVLAAGMTFVILTGGLVAFMRLPPFIVTLGGLTGFRGIARLLGKDTTVFNPQLPFAFVGNDSLFSIPWLVIIAFAVIIGSWFILARTVLGVHIYSVGGNESAARLSGIKVRWVLIFVYAVSGLLAGLGGVMSAARLYAANGLQLGTAYELDAIAAVILGGTSFVGGIGTIWGTLIGALIIAVLSNGLVLLGVSDVWQFIIKGMVIISAAALDRYRMKGSART